MINLWKKTKKQNSGVLLMKSCFAKTCRLEWRKLKNVESVVRKLKRMRDYVIPQINFS